MTVSRRESPSRPAPRRASTARRLAWSWTLLLALAPAFAPAQDDTATSRYLGVKTCAGSTCHGAGEDGDSRVLQNEFQTWHGKDQHARAYESLSGDRGRRIARNLGIEDATKAADCLVCHTTYAPEELRGKRFTLEDGVGCESCHGPASRWLGLHVTGESTREENLAVGMYPTEQPVMRAKLCLGCHLGSDETFADHRLMGAGHPRLSFELDTFTRIQPAHFRVDADYRERKQVASGATVWAIGQVTAARRLFGLFASGKHAGGGVFPEFAFFDCHACHHPFTEPRWQPRASMQLPPGTPHLNDANVLMLLALGRHLDGALAGRLGDALAALHAASQRSMTETVAAAGTLDGVLGDLESAVAAHPLDAAGMRAVLGALVDAGGDYVDYSAAEQATMAVAALVDALAEAGAIDAAKKSALATRVEALYAATEHQDAFQPAAFRTALETIRTELD